MNKPHTRYLKEHPPTVNKSYNKINLYEVYLDLFDKTIYYYLKLIFGGFK